MNPNITRQYNMFHLSLLDIGNFNHNFKGFLVAQQKTGSKSLLKPWNWVALQMAYLLVSIRRIMANDAMKQGKKMDVSLCM